MISHLFTSFSSYSLYPWLPLLQKYFHIQQLSTFQAHLNAVLSLWTLISCYTLLLYNGINAFCIIASLEQLLTYYAPVKTFASFRSIFSLIIVMVI